MWKQLSVAVALAAISAAPATAANGSSGKIVSLTEKRIAIHGITDMSCRIGPASPKTVHNFIVGSRVQLICHKGLLTAIRKLGTEPGVNTNVATSSSSSAIASVSSSNNGGSNTDLAAAGTGAPITALTATSITVEAAKMSISCTIAAGSPDVSGFKVGDHVSRLECRNGTLTVITRSS
jgi:hypothetical protein